MKCFLYFSPHPHVKHYHIKQNSMGEFFLSEKHCCASIPDLVNYHKHNSGGLASRLKTSPCDRPVPATAGLSHGLFRLITHLIFPVVGTLKNPLANTYRWIYNNVL